METYVMTAKTGNKYKISKMMLCKIDTDELVRAYLAKLYNKNKNSRLLDKLRQAKYIILDSEEYIARIYSSDTKYYDCNEEEYFYIQEFVAQLNEASVSQSFTIASTDERLMKFREYKMVSRQHKDKRNKYVTVYDGEANELRRISEKALVELAKGTSLIFKTIVTFRKSIGIIGLYPKDAEVEMILAGENRVSTLLINKKVYGQIIEASEIAKK